MRSAVGLPQEIEPPAAELRLLIAREPWSQSFLHNLGDLFRPAAPGPSIQFAPADFWPDVFVRHGLPWRRFMQSAIYHVLALVAIWEGSQFLALQPHPTARPAFTHEDVVYYSASEYLPPLDTRRPISAPARKADPEYSAQSIISVPPEADNHSQTLVTPPAIKLEHDVPVPNMVALLDKTSNPQMPIGPAPVVPASEISRVAPRMERSVIAPPPDVQASERKNLPAPQAAVIAPPPSMEADSTRRLGDLNVGHSAVIAPAPQLPLEEQRALLGRSSTALPSRGRSPDVIAPPPSLPSAGRSRSGGTTIALSLHPAVGAPPAGNRRGNFAATPEGHRGASGASGTSAGNNTAGGASAGNGKANGAGAGGKKNGDLPSGLYVGKTSNATSTVAGAPAPGNTTPSVNPHLLAGARPPRLPERTLESGSADKISEVERAVFGDRKFYSLTLNMPNLNSAAGSWIIRFAALKPDADPASPAARAAAAQQQSGGDPSADLSAPSARRKVDPAYPLEMMRQNVGGTVILYGVIRSDGTVGSVRVLRSVNDRLDRFASEAIAKWQFQPATKNGSAVDVEATFSIPFRPRKTDSNF